MNLVLIGYRATGKTSASKILAEESGRSRVSTDEETEKMIGVSIADYVVENGWPAFRKIEAGVIAELSGQGTLIIDAGGGVVEDPRNVENLRRDSLVVWLRAPVEEICARLRGDASRPSLTGGGDPAAEVEEILARRGPMYSAAAHSEIDTAGMNPSQIAGAIRVEAEKNGLCLDRDE